jgi:uncharacterized protein (TIGR02996 family)
MTWPPPVPDPHGEGIAAFLTAVAEEPDAAAPRLIFADWLEERGDPRAELVRLGWEAVRRPFPEPGWKETLDPLEAWWGKYGGHWLPDLSDEGCDLGFDRGLLSVALRVEVPDGSDYPALADGFRQGWMAGVDLMDFDVGEVGRAAAAGLFARAHSVSLGDSEVSDATLAHLAVGAYVRDLSVGFCWAVTDAGLRHLAGLTRLRRLDLWACRRVTEAGVNALREALPECEVNLR